MRILMFQGHMIFSLNLVRMHALPCFQIAYKISEGQVVYCLMYMVLTDLFNKVNFVYGYLFFYSQFFLVLELDIHKFFNILKLDIIQDNSSGKVLPATRIIAFLNHKYIFFQIQVVLFHTYLKKVGEINKFNTKMSNVYFCLTSISTEKRENTIVQSPPLTSLSIYSTTPFVI